MVEEWSERLRISSNGSETPISVSKKMVKTKKNARYFGDFENAQEELRCLL